MKNGPGGLLCATRPADFRAPIYLEGLAGSQPDAGPEDSRLPLSSLQVRATGTLHDRYPPPACRHPALSDDGRAVRSAGVQLGVGLDVPVLVPVLRGSSSDGPSG